MKEGDGQRGGRRTERGEVEGGRGPVKFGKSYQRRAAGVRGKLMSWFMQQWGLMRGDVLAEGGGAVTTLRWIRSICMFPHSSTQQCLRVWPLRAPSLSQTGVGDTYPGAHTVPSAHTRSRGTGGAVWSSLHLWGWLHSRSSQEASHRKDRTHLRSQHKGELAFHWQDTFSGGKNKRKTETSAFALHCYRSIIIGEHCRNVVKYLEIIRLLLLHHPTPTPP